MVGVWKRGGSETKGEVRKIRGVQKKGGARTPRTPAVYASVYNIYILYVYICLYFDFDIIDFIYVQALYANFRL